MEMPQPSVPIHSEAVHGALDPDGPGKENCGHESGGCGQLQPQNYEMI